MRRTGLVRVRDGELVLAAVVGARAARRGAGTAVGNALDGLATDLALRLYDATRGGQGAGGFSCW